jgi:hypothetical protein
MKKLILANTAAAMAAFALFGCGGGGGGGGLPATTPMIETNPGSNAGPVSELADTATLPSPPANTSPFTFTRDPAAESSLSEGLYAFRKVTVVGTSDCPPSGLTSAVTCPSFSRLILNSQGRWIADSWAYLPTKTQWVKLNNTADSSTSLVLGFSDAYSAGNSWINGSADLSALTGEQDNGQWKWIFDGGVIYKLSASSAPLSGSNIDISAPGLGSYTGTASAIDLYVIQESGQLYLRKKGGLWTNGGSTDDATVYPNLASFRQNHVSKPYCLNAAIGSSYNLSFNSSSGASFTKNIGICSGSNSTPIGSSAEGVTTVAGKKTILLSPVTDMLSGNNTSVNQYLIGISLNDGGVAAQGKVLQPGYALAKKGMINKEAFSQLIAAMYPDDSGAQNIPIP